MKKELPYGNSLSIDYMELMRQIGICLNHVITAMENLLVMVMQSSAYAKPYPQNPIVLIFSNKVYYFTSVIIFS